MDSDMIRQAAVANMLVDLLSEAGADPKARMDKTLIRALSGLWDGFTGHEAEEDEWYDENLMMAGEMMADAIYGDKTEGHCDPANAKAHYAKFEAEIMKLDNETVRNSFLRYAWNLALAELYSNT